MTTIPSWIEQRLDDTFERKLTQRHVVEMMLAAERPFFSAEQLRARVRPEVSTETVRNRLNELRKRDVVVAETYPDAITLYYINHPESNWPLSPEGRQALQYETPLDSLSLRDFLWLRNPAGIRTLVLAGFQWALALFVIGVLAAPFALDSPVESSNSYWASAGTLFLVCLIVLLAERVVRRVRRTRSNRDHSMRSQT